MRISEHVSEIRFENLVFTDSDFILSLHKKQQKNRNRFNKSVRSSSRAQFGAPPHLPLELMTHTPKWSKNAKLEEPALMQVLQLRTHTRAVITVLFFA